MKRFFEFCRKTNTQSLDEQYIIAPTAQQLGIKMKGGFAFHPSVMEEDDDNFKPIELKKIKRQCD